MTFSSTQQRVASSDTRRKILEVIVTSPEEAAQAERYGADRLELVRSLEEGGLTPKLGTVQAVLQAASIPVRVMVRENDSMSIAGEEELLRLQQAARSFSALPIDGLVLGFLADGVIDTVGLQKVLAAAPHCRVTFHRAFESVTYPQSALQTLKQFRQIDRILVRLQDRWGGVQTSDLAQWQKLATPEIEFIAGVGLERNNLSFVREHNGLHEVHAGRLLREPETASGCLSRRKFLELKSALE